MSAGRTSPMQATDDWARSPSAMFAAVVLGIASVCTLWMGVSRDLQRDHLRLGTTGSDVSPGGTTQPAIAGSARASAIRLIDVNRADLGELDLLPGIGPAMGQRIIEYRTVHGPFTTIESLQRVSGIGPRTLEKLRPLVTLGEVVQEPASDVGDGYTTGN